MCHAYGSRIGAFLASSKAWSDLGEDHGGGLTEREVCYLMEHEWARDPRDIRWRRTKLCFPMSTAERADFLARRKRRGHKTSHASLPVLST